MADKPELYDPSRVTVVDFDMPFWSMIFFMLKWACAAIPAMLVLFMVGSIAAIFFAGIIRGVGSVASLWPATSADSAEPVAPPRPMTPAFVDKFNDPKFVQSAIVGVGDSCDEVTRVFYQGGRPSATMFWNAACRNGKTYTISKQADDTIRVLSCEEMKRIARTDCFVLLDAQH